MITIKELNNVSKALYGLEYKRLTIWDRLMILNLIC